LQPVDLSFFFPVPHGGYVSSCILAAARIHFSTTLAHLQQPHTLALHLEFLRRTAPGRAIITFNKRKLGSRLSTLHVVLHQLEDGGKGDPRVEVEGYITQSNLAKEDGLTIQVPWSLTPSSAPADLSRLLREGEDDHWHRQKHAFTHFRRAAQNVTFYVPKGGQPVTGIADEWIRFQPGNVLGSGRWTNDSLGFVCDIFPHLVESYLQAQARTKDPERSHLFDRVDSSPEPLLGGQVKFWYPTVLLNIDFKKSLPDEGVEWLFLRVRAKRIQNGRMDYEIVVLDEGRDVVVVSNHINLIYGADRNVASRGGGGGGRGGLSTAERL
jgi:hypothetical protein